MIMENYASNDLIHIIFTSWLCCNPNLGFTTKARACKGVKEERIPKVTSHAPRGVGECERMNPHTPK
jgi:hypothetical protein